MLRKTIIALGSVLILVALSIVSSANSQVTPSIGNQIDQLGAEMDAEMIKYLESMRESFAAESSDDFVVFEVNCLAAATAIAATAAGNEDPTSGEEFFFAGLLQDKQRGIAAKITETSVVNTSGDRIKFSVRIADGVNKEDIVSILDRGIEFLSK